MKKVVRDISPMLFLPAPKDGKTLRKERLKLGVTQEEIAQVIGVTKATISHIERGLTNSPWALLMYTIIIERYKAYSDGYVPAYRKVGTNEFA